MLSIVGKSKRTLKELASLISCLSKDEYVHKIDPLNGSFIGEHTRHILEMFDELLTGYVQGVVNYDLRKRDRNLEMSRSAALNKIDYIINQLDQPDKVLILTQSFISEGVDTFQIQTNYHRELIYNIEHTVHHKALVRVAMHTLNIVGKIDERFGYADSTLLYKSQS